MIRTKRLTPALLNAWLVDQSVPNSHPTYRLRVRKEDRGAFAAIKEEAIAYFDEAFDDARGRLRQGFEDDLSPFNDPNTDPAANYPALLHTGTLQGYLGESLAVLAVEHWGAVGHEDWCVPAVLFRFHYQEFQHLDTINARLLAGEIFQPDAVAERRPGRTGDDALAFRIDPTGIITDVLTLEAKCLARNYPSKIKEAHEKLASAGTRPPGVMELVHILDEYETPAAHLWQRALLDLWKDGYKSAHRYDAVSYACGRVPAQPGRIAWMPSGQPHPAYTVRRRLDGIEFQFADLASVISSVYRVK